MKLGRLIACVTALTMSMVALAQGPGSGGSAPGDYGPGMMGGRYGVPGARGDGPGMMGGCGPGMMGGYGPGMMGGYGPGMMGGYGPGGGMRWGPGMMGYGMQGALDLSDDQRRKLDAIHDEVQSKNWDIAGKMRSEATRMRDLLAAEPRDRAALDAAFKRMSDLRQQRFDAQLAARDQIDGLLTKEQKQTMKRWGPWWIGEGD